MYYKQNLKLKNFTRGNRDELEEALSLLVRESCCLEDVNLRLKRLFKSISGIDFRIQDTTNLDMNELIEKGSVTVCIYNALFLPERVAVFDNVELNIKWYLTSIYINAFAHLFNGFPSVHGTLGFESLESYLGNCGIESDTVSKELFYILDVYRIISSAYKLFPGAVRIIKDILTLETAQNPSIRTSTLFNMILYRLLCNKNVKEINDKYAVKVDAFCKVVENFSRNCNDFHDVMTILPQIRNVFTEIFKNDKIAMKSYRRILSFYSDYSYCINLEQPPGRKNKFAGNNNQQKDKSEYNINASQRDGEGFAYNDDNKAVNGKNKLERKSNGFLYNEWNNDAQDYLYDWCTLHEVNSFFYMGNSLSLKGVLDKSQVKDVKQVFESLKPDLMKKRRGLPIGDEIELNTLVNYLVERRAKLCPEEKIYCKNFKDERDIAAALVIDVSGSTSADIDGKGILEIEKSAAFLLAEGLKELGDKFGIFGFSSLGRERCFYYIFKEFEEAWEDEQKQRLLGFYPNGTTRIGAAIRHTTEKLKKIDNQRKLMILITDGKPQDSDGYTTEGFYAQYDVRMACIEAKRNNIAVFCLSTRDNSLNELELMFPVKRYVIMRNITELPQLLAKSYIKLTI